VVAGRERARLWKCANRNGHGHNYTLEVTVAGEVDPVSGFVVDLKELKDILEREVVSVYDHRHLNLEVPEFKSTIPRRRTSRSQSGDGSTGKIPNAKLHRVRVYEMPDLFADYYGENVHDESAFFRGVITSAPRIVCIQRLMTERRTRPSSASATTRMVMAITTRCR
jgi:6-pyruvoyltetrahydropterin/6-carboxytetrahydropterin synthase